jgi:SAM-dependent methyltransferase
MAMKENKYDDAKFFDRYRQMPRSVKGLNAAGEWYAFRKMFPSLKDKRVLDLGCGFGWHCQFAAGQGAKSVVGVDISEKMLEVARNKATFSIVKYLRSAIEDLDFPPDSFDVVISSLAFHYIKSFSDVCEKVNNCLIPGGDFVFSVEHPIFTAYGNQDWYYDENGNRLYWPVDRYFSEGIREASFLGEKVLKYHKMVTTYVTTLLNMGYQLTGLVEPRPDPKILEVHPEYQDEMRRPMFLLVSAKK